jgi:hypothetical protein
MLSFVPKKDVYLGVAEGWAPFWVRCSVFATGGGNAAANE